jgi:hypothetical protein
MFVFPAKQPVTHATAWRNKRLGQVGTSCYKPQNVEGGRKPGANLGCRWRSARRPHQWPLPSATTFLCGENGSERANTVRFPIVRLAHDGRISNGTITDGPFSQFDR